MSFEPLNFSRGESFQVVFKNIVNTSGLSITSEPIALNATVYPELKILSMTPGDNATDGSLTEFHFCTNSPIKPKTKDNFTDALKTDSYFIFNRWENTYLRQPDTAGYPTSNPCNPGEYVSTVRYGLHPEAPYAIGLSLEDDFGQRVARTVRFTTRKPPEFYNRFQSLQKLYNVTTPDKTKFTYVVENLEYVNLHICKVRPEAMLSYLNQRPEATALNSSLSCADVRTDTIQLPKVYWVNNYFSIDLKKYFIDPRGQYVISFSHPDYRETYSSKGNGAKRQIYDRTYVSVTNLAVGEKKTQWTKYDSLPDESKASLEASGSLANLYWVSNYATLAPVINAEVRVYKQTGEYQGPMSFAVTGITGEDGVARIPLTKDIVGAVITSGTDSAIISSWTDTLQWARYASGNRMIYVYTDRPIYRPGHDVHIKGIYRFQYDGRYEIFKDKNISVSVFNPKGDSIMSQEVPLSDFGTFVAHLKLPIDAALGSYRIEALGSSFYFDVAEYQGAAFEASVTADQEEYVAGDTAQNSPSR